MSGDGLGYHRKSLVSRAGCQTVSKGRDLWQEGYGSDFMSGFEYLHPLLGELKQHIQGRVTWSETKKYMGFLQYDASQRGATV